MNMNSYDCCNTNNQSFSKIQDLSQLLKLVSDHSRLRILCVLKNNERCVCDIIQNIHLSQSLISHHLSDLKNADLVVDRKEGKWVYYSLTSKGQQITKLIFQIKL